MKFPIYKIYVKVLSGIAVLKSMAFFKRTVKVPDIHKHIKTAAVKEQAIIKQQLVHDECPISEERETKTSSSHIFQRILRWPNISPIPASCHGSAPSYVIEGTHKKVSIYKMGEYKITEKDSDELLWEMHFGMGALKEGKCFRKGQILFLGPACDERAGFLKGEFLDHIKPFPCWLKTRFYCPGPHIRRCDTGKKVSAHEMLRWANDPEHHLTRKAYRQKNHPHLKRNGPDENTIEVSYSLNDHEIVKKGNGVVLWKKSGTLNRVNSGWCIIMEDILFIGPSENEHPDTQKRLFHERLKLLPKWDDTEYYACDFEILECNPVK
jgi:hypothetical protein